MAFETINLGNQPTGTGGDTARSAFEKVNKNFITAEVLASSMSQAQFEAIRAQNNEKYAASGFVHFGKHGQGSGDVAVNQGLYINPVLVNHMRLGRPDIQNAGGLSKTDYPEINIAGVIFDIKANSSAFSYLDIKLPSAPDGKTTYNKSTGANIVYATTTATFNAAAVDVNLEVVTDRVDMWGFESWLEEVSATNPYVYPNGLIQSLATTMDGIATVVSNRPVTYYAWFDGDASSKGKGINYFNLNDAQKRKVLANHKNKLFFLDDGRLVQWRLRGRSFAGAGNGDWDYVDANGFSDLKFKPSNSISPQGKIDTYQGFVVDGSAGKYTFSRGGGNTLSIFERHTKSDVVGANGECYFLVCGTVNRLNQGAYHPSFNPSGAGAWNSNIGYGREWHVGIVNGPINNIASAFYRASNTSEVGQPRYDQNKDGSIGGASGRPDGRFYDAIYADGQGGVCRDMRYSANHTTLEKFAEADSKVKNGTYRGFEKLKFTPTRIPVKNLVDKGSYYQVTLGSDDKYIEGILNAVSLKTVFNPCSESIIRRTGLKIQIYGDSFASGNSLVINCAKTTDIIVGDDIFLPTMYEEIDFSVGGSFLKTDVIGNPANILLADTLKNGWEGGWVPIIPNGTLKLYPATRKSLSSAPLFKGSSNNGVTWSNGTMPSWSDSLNGSTYSESAGGIIIMQYTAFAKQTEDAPNFDIHGGLSGVGSVFSNIFNSRYYGVLLGESLIGKISTSSLSSTGVNSSLAILDCTTASSRSLFDPSSYAYPKHSPLTFGVPASGLVGYKALDYNVNISQQAFKQYAYTEIISDGTDWGDDSLIAIVNGKTYKNDLNGKSVVVGTAKLKEPIGWIKNTI